MNGLIADAYAGRTILITGGRGYVGSALAQALADVGCRLVLTDRSPSDAWRPEDGRAEVGIVKGDLSVSPTWDAILPGADYVFQLAGTEYLRSADCDPILDWQSNALPTVHLLEVCRKRRYSPKIVFSSSAHLFGLVDALPVSEDRPSDPLIPWAAHKLMAESYLRIYAQEHGIASVILRLANVYGPTARRSASVRVVLNKMIADAVAGQPLTLYDNRHCIRDYVFLDDVVRALLLAGAALAPPDGRLYVIGSGEGRSIADVCQLIARQVCLRTGRDVPIQVDGSLALHAFERRDFVADTTRFQRATAWKPRVSLERGIGLTIEAVMMAETSSPNPKLKN